MVVHKSPNVINQVMKSNLKFHVIIVTDQLESGKLFIQSHLELCRLEIFKIPTISIKVSESRTRNPHKNNETLTFFTAQRKCIFL